MAGHDSQPGLEASQEDSLQIQIPRTSRSSSVPNEIPERPRLPRGQSVPANYAPAPVLDDDSMPNLGFYFPEPIELITADQLRVAFQLLRVMAVTITDHITEERHRVTVSELIQYFGADGACLLLHQMGRCEETPAVENWRDQNPDHPSTISGPLAHLAGQPPHPTWHPLLVEQPQHTWLSDIPRDIFNDGELKIPTVPRSALRYIPCDFPTSPD